MQTQSDAAGTLGAGGKRILLADDHSSIRKGVRVVLEDELSNVEFGEASNAIEVFKKIKEKNWDLLILDMDMPGRNGLEVLKQLKDEKVPTSVLMFSMHPETQVAVRALKAGAHGYLAKASTAEELVNAVRLVLSGRKYITASLAEKIVGSMENPSDIAPHELLSDREYQTMQLFARGKTTSQIASELSLSVSTITTFRARILEKMNMKTTAEVMEYAIRNKLV